MGRYGNSLGIWNLKVGGADFLLTPQMGDNYKLLKLLEQSKKNNQVFMEKIGEFIEDIIKRDYPPSSEDEVKELKQYVEFNLTELMQELMVAFKLTTREKLAELQQGEQVKNLMSGI